MNIREIKGIQMTQIKQINTEILTTENTENTEKRFSGANKFQFIIHN
jgi:hypothetical protein